MANWHSLDVKELLKRFKAREIGIKQGEAERRLEQYGENSISIEKKISVLPLLIEQFTSPLVLMLFFAALFSLFFEKAIDGILIISIMIGNGLFGFLQNYNAEKSIEALKKLGSLKALVYRNGALVEVPAEKIVPGDVVLLREGSKVPADCRLLESSELEIDESILTGESNPVSKKTGVFPEETLLADRLNMAFMDTLVVRGKAKALVVATGKTTEVGKIAKQLQEIKEEPTRFHIEIEDLSKKIGGGILVLIVIIGLTLFFIQNTSIIDVVFTSISLAVAAIPEGLPAVVTLSLAIATRRMLKKKSLVRKLSVVEELGSVEIICTDKTGTLTENSMTVQEIYSNNRLFEVTGTGKSVFGDFLENGKKVSAKALEKILLCGMACNDTISERNGGELSFIGDPTEIALTVSAMKAGINLEGMKRTKDYAFSSARKRMTAVYDYGAKKTAFSKGAPEIIIESCSKMLVNGKEKPFTRKEKDRIIGVNNGMASKALRVLGFAYKDLDKKEDDAENSMVFLGLQGMIDPPREEVKSALETARSAGIRVIMLTGDNKITANAIAEKIGFTGKTIDASELKDLSQQEFGRAVEECDVFSRVSPHEKLAVLNYLKEKGHSVAMTGDGVNDAPSLKKADVGISMGLRGSDVAKESSDIVLLDDNFSTIIEAVKEGRNIFENIQKFVRYLLTSNLAEVLIVFISSIAGVFMFPGSGLLALTPIQLLWINLLTDGMPALALGADPPKPGIMGQKPRKSNEGIINRRVAESIAGTGAILTVIVCAIFFQYLSQGVVMAQTMAFTSLIIYEFVRIVGIREEEELGFFSNKWLVAALAGSIILQFTILYNPLGSGLPFNEWFGLVPLKPADWGVIVLGGVVAYVANMLLSRALLGRHDALA